MHPDILQISKLSLFNGIDTGELIDIFEESRFIYSSYEPGRVIKFRGEKIEDLMILLYGDVKTEMEILTVKPFRWRNSRRISYLLQAFCLPKTIHCLLI